MEFKTVVKKVGGSSVILIPYNIIDRLNLVPDDEISVSVMKLTSSYKHFRCKVCQYSFDAEDDCDYCPSCSFDGCIETVSEAD